jgi:hypothetical protein
MLTSNGITWVTVRVMLHICADRRGYAVQWDGRPEDVTKRVIEFLGAKSSTHAWDVLDLPPTMTALQAWLYPECEHGLSLSNCYGPQHYYMDDEERHYMGY